MNALGETTLVTDYIPRSRRQRGGQGPKGLPIAIETSQPIRPTNELHIPARVGDLDATATDVGDEVHERGYFSPYYTNMNARTPFKKKSPSHKLYRRHLKR